MSAPFDHTPAEARALLVAALRSGEYTQVAGQLRARDQNENLSHCCLGVACDLFAKHEPNWKSQWDNFSNQFITLDDEPRSGYLPKTIRNWLGFHTNMGALRSPISDDTYVANDLTDLNDTLEWSFSQIADVIEGGNVCVHSNS